MTSLATLFYDSMKVMNWTIVWPLYEEMGVTFVKL